jgi:hypothetical protein
LDRLSFIGISERELYEVAANPIFLKSLPEFVAKSFLKEGLYHFENASDLTKGFTPNLPEGHPLNAIVSEIYNLDELGVPASATSDPLLQSFVEKGLQIIKDLPSSDTSSEKPSKKNSKKNLKITETIETLGDKTSKVTTGDGEGWVRYAVTNDDDRDQYKRVIERFRVLEELDLANGITAKWSSDGKAFDRTYIKGKTLKEIIETEPTFFTDSKHPAAIAFKNLFEELTRKKVYVGAMTSNALVYDGEKWNIIKPGRIRQREKLGLLIGEYVESLFASWSHNHPEHKANIKSYLERITCSSIMGELIKYDATGERTGFISP